MSPSTHSTNAQGGERSRTTSSGLSKLVLIDGNAILHRAFHALPPMTTKRGEPINAVYGFVSMILKIVQDLRPTALAVAFDEKEPTFRHKEFADYQAQRPPTHEDLSSQFEKARRFVEAAGVPVYSKGGYEADDVIGTLASLATETKNKRHSALSFQSSAFDEVVIVTGDRDQLQLVNDKVKIYMPISGLSNAKMMGKEEVIEKMGVEPSQIADFKGLAGDASDNYKGVSGVGPKTAISLLSKFKSMEEIYKNLDKIDKKTAEKLKKGQVDANLSLRLAKIVTDVPIQYDMEASAKWDLDSPKVIALFEAFGFKTLKERIKKVGEQIDKEKQLALL